MANFATNRAEFAAVCIAWHITPYTYTIRQKLIVYMQHTDSFLDMCITNQYEATNEKSARLKVNPSEVTVQINQMFCSAVPADEFDGHTARTAEQ